MAYIEYRASYSKGNIIFTCSEKKCSDISLYKLSINVLKTSQSTMKNFSYSKTDDESVANHLAKLIDLLVSTQSARASLGRVNMRGKNVGAAMIARRGSTSESIECCNINIYINNNVQGVSNSVLVGSEVHLGDPGVGLSIGDVDLGKGLGRKMRTLSAEFRVVFVFLVIVVIIWLFYLF